MTAILAIGVALAGEPVQLDLAAAEEAPPLTHEQYEWLEPRRSQLPAPPRQHVDFTAYTLEWSEVSAGLVKWQVGVLPRTQLGTIPGLLVLGVPNAEAKLNALTLGPVDLAATGTWASYGVEGFDALRVGLGGRASLQLLDPLSVHGGLSWNRLTTTGVPDLGILGPLLGLDAAEAASAQDALDALDTTLLTSTALTVASGAADWRFNRRDSLILQGSWTTRGSIQATVGGQVFGQQLEKTLGRPLTDSWAASLSYQASLNHLQLRLGLGTSSLPGAWLLQSTELAWRFGGPTRAEERRMRAAWKANRRDIRA